MTIINISETMKKHSEKKSYSQPQLQEIGKMNSITKGLSGSGTDLGSRQTILEENPFG